METQLAVVLLRTGRYHAGLGLLKTVVERLKSIPKGEHALADSRVRLGYALLEAGAAEEAERLFRDALDHHRTFFPAKHPRIADVECGLGVSLALQGKSKEAEDLIHKSLPIFSSWGPADPVEVKRIRQRLDALRKLPAKG